MYCIKCGIQLEQDAMFCIRCGTPVEAAEQSQQAYYQQSEQQYQDTYEQQPQQYQDPYQEFFGQSQADFQDSYGHPATQHQEIQMRHIRPVPAPQQQQPAQSYDDQTDQYQQPTYMQQQPARQYQNHIRQYPQGTTVPQRQQVSAQQQGNPYSRARSKKKPPMKLIIGAASVVVALAVALVLIFGGNSPERVVTRYLEGFVEGDFSVVSRYSALDVDNFMSEIFRIDGLTERQVFEELGVQNMSELFNMAMEEGFSQLERSLGGNIRHSIEILDYNNVSRSEKEDILERLERRMDRDGIRVGRVIDIDDITEMREFNVELTSTGRDNEVSERLSIMLVRVGRNWRVLDYDLIWSEF